AICRIGQFAGIGPTLRQTLSTLNGVFLVPINGLDGFGLLLFAACQCTRDDQGKNDSLHFRTSKASESMAHPLAFMARETSTASKIRNATRVRTALSRIPTQDGPASKRRPAFIHDSPMQVRQQAAAMRTFSQSANGLSWKNSGRVTPQPRAA